MRFCIDVEKQLHLKDKVNFKIYDFTTWLTNNCNTHIDQYFKKFRQSDNEAWLVNRIQHKKYFFEKSYTKCGGETIPRPFSKKSKLNMSLDQLFKVLYSLYWLYTKFRTIEIYWNYDADYLLLQHIKFFWQTKRGLEPSISVSSSVCFWRKVFLLLNSITWPNFIVWLSSLREILGNVCIAIVC